MVVILTFYFVVAGPPPKVKETEPAPIAERPKRLSAGKTLDFLAEARHLVCHFSVLSLKKKF